MILYDGWMDRWIGRGSFRFGGFLHFVEEVVGQIFFLGLELLLAHSSVSVDMRDIES